MKEYTDEIHLLLRTQQVDEEALSEEDKLLRLSIHFDPYSDTRVEDYDRLKKEVSKVDIGGILARELEKTRIDPALTKQAISALKVVEPEPRKRILSSILQLDNLQSLAPAFPRLMIVLRGLYTELDEETQDLIDDALIKLVQTGSFIVKIDLNLCYLLQILRRRSSQRKEELFVRLFKGKNSPLIRREIILGMTEWGYNHWLADLKKMFNGLSKWERRCCIVASYFLTDEGKHWRNHNKSLFDLSELVVRDWFADRFQTNPTVPQ